MKKILLTSLMALFAIIAVGCAEEESDTNTGSTPPSYTEIPQEEKPLEIQTGSATITITNPRNETVYPIMINTAMGMNGEADLSEMGMGIVKGIGYDTFFGTEQMYFDKNGNFTTKPNLTFGVARNGWDGMYNLTSGQTLANKANGQYHIIIDVWNADKMATSGELVFAFLTEEEAKKYLPYNKNIKLLPADPSQAASFKAQYIDAKTIEELNKLGALKKYKWQEKAK